MIAVEHRAELVPLLVIMVTLLFFKRGLPSRGELVRPTLGRAPRPRSLLLPTLVGTAVGAAALLVTSGSWRAAVIGTFIAAVLGLSLVVVTGYAGQVSLAQLALAGTAAFSLSYLTQTWDLPFPLAPLLASRRHRRPLAVDEFCRVAARFSALVAALGSQLAEIDLNPVIVHADGCAIVDALLVPRAAETPLPEPLRQVR